jgi:hypothetical protein
MLLQGAAIVRFANTFLNAFCQEMNFVLCAFFIWDNGTATRYILFQLKRDQTVCCALYNIKLESSSIVGLLQNKESLVE